MIIEAKTSSFWHKKYMKRLCMKKAKMPILRINEAKNGQK